MLQWSYSDLIVYTCNILLLLDHNPEDLLYMVDILRQYMVIHIPDKRNHHHMVDTHHRDMDMMHHMDLEDSSEKLIQQ